MPDWAVWIVIAGGLAILEVLAPVMVFILLAGGALAGALVAAAGGGLLLQVVAFGAVSVAGLLVVRPRARRSLEPPETLSGTKSLPGREALVIGQVDSDGGRVKINGEEWSARAYDPGQVIEPGTKVTIVDIQGATAVVWSGP